MNKSVTQPGEGAVCSGARAVEDSEMRKSSRDSVLPRTENTPGEELEDFLRQFYETVIRRSSIPA